MNTYKKNSKNSPMIVSSKTTLHVSDKMNINSMLMHANIQCIYKPYTEQHNRPLQNTQ